MKPFDLVQGQSDPVSYTCTCNAGEEGGSVLLFYRYWSNDPSLPEEHLAQTAHPAELASWHEELTRRLNLGGKLRIAKEGFNITVAGTRAEIVAYISECCAHWSFSGLSLDTKSAQDKFFKPSDGCACVFSKVSSVRVAAEITPMGVEGYLPSDWSRIESLPPAEFHERCLRGNNLLVDVRNHYESKIGYFVDPQTGEPALRPPVRRFSQWPQFVKHHMQNLQDKDQDKPKQIMTYCTGGIRCEKAVRWMEENTPQSEAKIATLKGGIAAYLTWMSEEIKAGRKSPHDSLFKGRNYVFDARGSTGLTEKSEPVSTCHLCGVPCDRLSKCHTKGCHLVLVACHACETGELRCCQSCRELDITSTTTSQDQRDPRSICNCEKEREKQLWGGERVKTSRTRRSRKQRNDRVGSSHQIDIRIKVIDKS